MALVAHELGYTYGAGTGFAVEALSGVDVSVAPGEVLVVAGATGSGKSTLLRLLAGLLRPTSGSVLADGVDPGSRDARGMVAIVFQNPETQFFAETVLADVAFGPKNLGAPDPLAAAAAALDTVGLDPEVFGSRSPFALSGGEGRRAAIAGALAMGARYVLLDEPTAGLDAAGRRDVVAAVLAEREHAGIVVVTHDAEDFLPHADRVLALSVGAAAFLGTVGEVFERHAEYEEAGLRLPELVRLQLAAQERGLPVARVEFDPVAAADALLAARSALGREGGSA